MTLTLTPIAIRHKGRSKNVSPATRSPVDGSAQMTLSPENEPMPASLWALALAKDAGSNLAQDGTKSATGSG